MIDDDDDDDDRIIVWYRRMNAYIFGIQWLLMMMLMIKFSSGTDVWTRIFYGLFNDDDNDRIFVLYRRMKVYIFEIDKLKMFFYFVSHLPMIIDLIIAEKCIVDDKISAASDRNSKKVSLKQISKKHNVPKSTYIFLLQYFYYKCVCINSTQMPLMNYSIIGKH